jgi:hypothetical protein
MEGLSMSKVSIHKELLIFQNYTTFRYPSNHSTSVSSYHSNNIVKQIYMRSFHMTRFTKLGRQFHRTRNVPHYSKAMHKGWHSARPGFDAAHCHVTPPSNLEFACIALV